MKPDDSPPQAILDLVRRVRDLEQRAAQQYRPVVEHILRTLDVLLDFCGDDRSLHHDQSEDETRCDAGVLEDGRHRAGKYQGLEAQGRPARIPALSLSRRISCGDQFHDLPWLTWPSAPLHHIKQRSG